MRGMDAGDLKLVNFENGSNLTASNVLDTGLVYCITRSE